MKGRAKVKVEIWKRGAAGKNEDGREAERPRERKKNDGQNSG